MQALGQENKRVGSWNSIFGICHYRKVYSYEKTEAIRSMVLVRWWRLGGPMRKGCGPMSKGWLILQNEANPVQMRSVEDRARSA
jgi:hypothetical protein